MLKCTMLGAFAIMYVQVYSSNEPNSGRQIKSSHYGLFSTKISSDLGIVSS